MFRKLQVQLFQNHLLLRLRFGVPGHDQFTAVRGGDVHAHQLDGRQRPEHLLGPEPRYSGSSTCPPNVRAVAVLVFWQGVDELVDFAFAVVAVRAGPEAAATDRDHDTVLRLQVLLDLVVVVNVGEKGKDTAGLAGST